MGIGYVRPVQFLDHLTVIKRCKYCYLIALSFFVAQLGWHFSVGRWGLLHDIAEFVHIIISWLNHQMQDSKAWTQEYKKWSLFFVARLTFESWEMRSLAWQKPNWPRPNCCNLTTDQPTFVRILLSSLCQVLPVFSGLLIWNLFIHWKDEEGLSDFFLFCWCDIWHSSCVMVDLIIMLRKLARLTDHWGKIRKDKARPSD